MGAARFLFAVQLLFALSLNSLLRLVGSEPACLILFRLQV